MSDIEIKYELEGEYQQNANSLNQISLVYKKNWEELTTLISKNIKKII